MSLFNRGKGEEKQPGKDSRKHGSHSSHSQKEQQSAQWRTAKYHKLSENQRTSLDRILTVLKYEIQ
jgi:hypothetical protein